MVSRSCDSPLISFSRRSIAPENLVPSLSTVPTTVLRLSISSCTVWLLSAKRVRKRRRLGQQRLQGSALALEDLNERCAERIDVLRVEALGNRFQPTEQQVEVERRRRAIDRDLGTRAAARLVDPGPSTSSR